jgi:drug/metabolite transporter (DMT)-like permease
VSERPLPRKTALIVALIGLAAVSHAVIFIRLADDAPAFVIALARVALATAVFAPFGLMAARRLGGIDAGVKRRAGLLSLVAGLFLALHFASWIASLERITIAESTVLVSLTPLWVAILDSVMGRGRPTRALFLSILLCLAGTAILAFEGARRVDGDPIGLALAAAGGVFIAFYLVIGRDVRTVLPTSAYVTVCYGSAALFLAGAVFATGAPILGYGMETYAALLALGLVSQVIGHTSYNWTLSTLPPAFVAICLLGEPVIGALLGWLYLGEVVPVAAALGGVLILAGIWLAIRAEIRRG